MTIRKQTIRGALIILSLLMIGVSGCVWGQKAVVIGAAPTCDEALSTGLQEFSDDELALFLDNSLAEDRKSECWIPIMEAFLNENRKIPRRHLAEAVKTFNKRALRSAFSQSRIPVSV